MKPLLFILTLLICSESYGQNVYYFSNNGNDNNSGKIDAPLKTIGKLNKLELKPGDNVRFHCGESFTGQVNITASGTKTNPITFSSYGQGSKPIISGSAQVKNWVKLPGSNIWQSPLNSKSPITDLYINSKVAPLSRYPKANAPNKGFLTVASHTNLNQLTSKEKIDGNWVGAEIVYMPNQWLIEKGKITGQNGNTFTINKPDKYEIANNWGFFIQNYIGGLVSDGDWCFDTAKNVVSLYYAKGNPNDQNIEITYFGKGINLVNCSNIVLYNLEVDKTTNCAVWGSNVSGITINTLKIDNSGEDGILIKGNGSDILIENTNINHTNNDAVSVTGPSNFRFINNTIKNTGLKPGRGKSSSGHYTALEYSSDTGNATIQGNTIDSVGYIGIYFMASNITVKNNFVSNFCLVKSDGGGIYTWDGDHKNRINQVITGNIVLGSSADSVPVSHVRPVIAGAYLDDCSQNITVTDNTFANCANSGIFLHGAKNINVAGNTCYNNKAQYSLLISVDCDITGNTTQNNIFFSMTKSQLGAVYGKERNAADDYGNFNNNLYFNPDPSQSILNGFNEESAKSHRISLSDWKSQFSKDMSSSSLGGVDMYNNDIKFIYNASQQAKVFQLNGKYKDVKNNILNGQVTLKPYTSAILLKTQ